MNVQPFARVSQPLAQICTSSRSDLMTFLVSNSIAGMLQGGMLQFHPLFSCFFHVRCEHSPCATTLTNTTSWRKKKGEEEEQPSLVPESYFRYDFGHEWCRVYGPGGNLLVDDRHIHCTVDLRRGTPPGQGGLEILAAGDSGG